MSHTDYDWKVLPWKICVFGKLHQTLFYDCASKVENDQISAIKAINLRESQRDYADEL